MDIAVEPQPPFVTLPFASITTCFGKGNGTFTAGPTSLIEQNPFQTFQLVAGDFDHDGFPDVAGIDQEFEPGHVRFLFGDGAGNFASQQISGPMGYAGFVTGDINGDGIPDVVVPDRFGIVSVILGQQGRSFPTATSFSTIPQGPGGPVSAADVNGDHKIDILASSRTSSSTGNLYLNQGNNQFSLAGHPPGQGFLLADLNQDGFAELIGSDSVNLLIWQGTGNPDFPTSPIVIPPPAGASLQGPMQIADMDGDGLPDVVFPNVILYNQGNLTFLPVQIPFNPGGDPFVIADLNHDGVLDLATTGTSLLGLGNRTFKSVSPNGLNLTSSQAAVPGDFNGDGNADLVSSGNGIPVLVTYGRGDGTFYEQSFLNVGPPGDYSVAFVVSDFDGDGKADILACLSLSQQCVVYTNDGRGGFSRSYFASGANSIAVLQADFNGDGKPDVAISNYAVDFRPSNFLIVYDK